LGKGKEKGTVQDERSQRELRHVGKGAMGHGECGLMSDQTHNVPEYRDAPLFFVLCA